VSKVDGEEFPAVVLRSTVTLYLYYGCGHQDTLLANATTMQVGDRVVSFPSVICSPENCPRCRMQEALDGCFENRSVSA
jgi:hypothetical protein